VARVASVLRQLLLSTAAADAGGAPQRLATLLEAGSPGRQSGAFAPGHEAGGAKAIAHIEELVDVVGGIFLLWGLEIVSAALLRWVLGGHQLAPRAPAWCLTTPARPVRRSWARSCRAACATLRPRRSAHRSWRPGSRHAATTWRACRRRSGAAGRGARGAAVSCCTLSTTRTSPNHHTVALGALKPQYFNTPPPRCAPPRPQGAE
jgi:hypothetical protein